MRIAERMQKAESRKQKAEAPLPPQAAAVAAQSEIGNRKSKIPWWLLAAVLVLVTIALYWPATGYDFVNYDDDVYVTSNVHVQNGLTWESIRWACSSSVAANWHPVTVWSHMLVCQVFGLRPWGHHFANVLLHALNAGLIFALLRQMTGATWRSLFVAALFAVHPLRVESVAWVSERKDVLSGFFGLLALIFYARYAQGRREKAETGRQNPGTRNTQHATPFYLFSLFFFALGLMSKPMLVTWPFVMLLLDYWPLRRMQNAEITDGGQRTEGRGQRSEDGNTQHATRNTQHAAQSQIANRKSQIFFPLLFEKIPFFALVALSSVVTFEVQKRAGALVASEYLPLGARAGNALLSCCRYLGKLFWPSDLAVFYGHPGQWPMGRVLLAGGLILGLSALLWVRRRRYPYLLVGWLWFLGTLVPVIGLVQVGQQAMADRYTYIPSLGVLILAIWGACELVQGKAEGRRQKTEDRGQRSEDSNTQHATRNTPQSPILLWVAGATAIVLFGALTRQQIGHWAESEALFRHALQVTGGNARIHNNLATVLEEKGQIDEAIRQFQEAIRLNSDYPDYHNNLGVALDKKGEFDEAIRQYEEALRLKPDYADAHNNLGYTLDKKGQSDEAIRHYQAAIRLKPEQADTHSNLGVALDKKGEFDEAIRQYQAAIRLKPEQADAYNNLGDALVRKGEIDEAIRQFQEAIRLRPNYADAHNNLGNALDKKGQSDAALRQFQEAIRLKPDHADGYYNFGIALGRKGQIDEAILQFQAAIRLKPDHAEGHYNLGIALSKKGRIDEAMREYQAALRLRPNYSAAHKSLGNAFDKKGQTDEAIRQFQEAIRLKPDDADAHNNLGNALDKIGQSDESIRQYQAALRLKPDRAEGHYNLGLALGKKGQSDEAIRQFQEALRLKPDFAEAHCNLGTASYQQGRTGEAIREFQEALRLKPDYADARRNLDAALAAKAK